MAPLPVPLAIHRGEREIVITWSDDHRATYPARYLRLRCKCAQCEEEMTGRPILDPASVSGDIDTLAVGLVGSYAIHINWTDGHHTGIYTFENLLRDCPCPKCSRVGR